MEVEGVGMLVGWPVVSIKQPDKSHQPVSGTVAWCV